MLITAVPAYQQSTYQSTSNLALRTRRLRSVSIAVVQAGWRFHEFKIETTVCMQISREPILTQELPLRVFIISNRMERGIHFFLGGGALSEHD